jgi:hypothetical protein
LTAFQWMTRNGISTSSAIEIVVMQLMRFSFRGTQYLILWEMLDEG